jgi:hypothetical protein
LAVWLGVDRTRGGPPRSEPGQRPIRSRGQGEPKLWDAAQIRR